MTSGLAAAALTAMMLSGPATGPLALLPQLSGGGTARGGLVPAVATPVSRPAAHQAAEPTARPSGSLPAAPPPAPSSPGPAASSAPPAPHPPPEPATPANVAAAAAGPDAIQVSWTASLAGLTGFRIRSGCPAGGCTGSPATVTAGPVTAVTVAVTPGTSECFRVKALAGRRASDWSGYGCATTPGLVLPGPQQWTDTGVTLSSGDRAVITAAGLLTGPAGQAMTPAGDPSCTPSAGYPDQSAAFPAPDLPCWSLVGRIGTGPVFEVGTAAQVTGTAGRLYLAVNEPGATGDSGSWTVDITLGGAPAP